MVFDWGFDSLEYNGMPWNFDDTDAPRDAVWIWVKGDIQKFVVKDLGVEDRNGKTLRWVSGYDMWCTWYRAYFNVACRHPNWHVRIEDLSQPTL